MANIIPVILSGGSGTRLWPLSRELRPKQFLPVVDDETLFQSTIKRLSGIQGAQSPLIVCNENHRFLAAEQLREISKECQSIILEPSGKNTAPAITLAALWVEEHCSPNDIMLVLPADHVMRQVSVFEEAVKFAVEAAQKNQLVTFGVVPKSAETGYGYIRHDSSNNVLGFVEKPDKAKAIEYLKSGEYLWNSGMFMFAANVYLEAIKKHQPEILENCKISLSKCEEDGAFMRVEKEAFEACSSISVDYAIMEKASNVAVVPLDAGWNDVGTWPAVWEVGAHDEKGNVMKGDVISSNAHQNLVHSEQHLVTLIGVNNLVVIDTKDALLVAHKDCVNDIKDVVEQLKLKGRSEGKLHREVFRPWGHYDCIDRSERFQVKKIVVNPGAKLSLQKHHHRSEHWIVVKGTAEVRCGDKVSLLTENESVYIPLGELHSLSNPGKVQLEIIEVQSGSYLGEDDIVRYEDKYGRVGTQNND